MATASQKLLERQRQTQSRLCIGLDPDEHLVPDPLRREREPWKRLLQEVVPATAPYACAYKLNLTFYLAFGATGWRLLEETLSLLPRDIPVILDGKWGDVPHTATVAARITFEQLGVDAVTVNPLLGMDSVTPFLAYSGKLIFVLARTSNVGAKDFLCRPCPTGYLLYEHIVTTALGWSGQAEIGFVVGATAPNDFARVRQLAPQSWLLVPGVGIQGGNAVALVQLNGYAPLIVNVGRAILYASNGTDFAEAAARAAASFARIVRLEPEG